MMRELAYKLAKFLEEKFKLPLCVIYARDFDYTKQQPWAENWFKQNCPFCNSIKDVVKEYSHCYLIKNLYPYRNTQDHLLIVPKRHIRTWNELNVEELQQIQSIIWDYLDKWYLLLGRQFVKKGCINHASVHHLHIHLILNTK